MIVDLAGTVSGAYKDTGNFAEGLMDKMTEQELRSAKEMMGRALGETGTAFEAGDMYSLKRDNNGNEYWEIDTEKDIFKGLETKDEYSEAAYNFLIGNRKNKVVVTDKDGEEITFLRLSAREFTHSKESANYYNTDEDTFSRKMRMIPSLQDLLLNYSTKWTAPDHKQHRLFNRRGFDNYRGRVKIDNVIFNTIVRVGKADLGNVFYDINLEVDTYLPHAKSASSTKKVSTSSTIIPQANQNSNNFSEKNNEQNVNSDEKLYSLKDINAGSEWNNKKISEQVLNYDTKDDIMKENNFQESRFTEEQAAKSNLRSKIRYSVSGLKLPKHEQAKFLASVSTDYYMDYKTHEGLQYQSCVYDDKHILYIYEDGGFNTYNVVARIDYSDVEVANTIIGVLTNGVYYRITEVINAVLKTSKIGRCGYTVYNARTKKRISSRGDDSLPKRQSSPNTRGIDASSSGFSRDQRRIKHAMSEVDSENGENSYSFKAPPKSIPDMSDEEFEWLDRIKRSIPPERWRWITDAWNYTKDDIRYAIKDLSWIFDEPDKGTEDKENKKMPIFTREKDENFKRAQIIQRILGTPDEKKEEKTEVLPQYLSDEEFEEYIRRIMNTE